ncbi:transposase family protein [Candidatus Woesearchaeota archaeon]|nr:transposase family protein [Candidatus Woesearchaeota archaeon]
MKRPHSMWHGDVMTGTRLPNGTLFYQCTIEDDYSRGYSGHIATCKDARIVLHALIDAILRWKSIPTCFHYDNGGEAKCKLVQTFLQNVAQKCNKEITFIPTKLYHPQGNGKKERAHKDDRRDFWRKNKSKDLKYTQKKFEKYLYWRNEKKGHFALKGKPSITRLQENKKPLQKFTRKQLENLAKVKIAERRVKPLGIVYLFNKIYHVEPKLKGSKVELWETLKGLEIRNGKRIYCFIEEYWEKKSKLSNVVEMT